MKKTILSLTLAGILGLSLTGCGSGAGAGDIINDANNFTKDKIAQDFQETTKEKLTKSYDGKYLPLYDATNDTKEAIRLYDNISKAELYDAINGVLITTNADVVISSDGKTMTIKNLYGANQDLILSIIKKDGGEFLTKGNTTWDTGITCDSIEEVKTKLQTQTDTSEDNQDPKSDIAQLNTNDVTYQMYINDTTNTPFGSIAFTSAGNVTIEVDGEEIYSGEFREGVEQLTDGDYNPIDKWLRVIYVDGAELEFAVSNYEGYSRLGAIDISNDGKSSSIIDLLMDVENIEKDINDDEPDFVGIVIK